MHKLLMRAAKTLARLQTSLVACMIQTNILCVGSFNHRVFIYLIFLLEQQHSFYQLLYHEYVLVNKSFDLSKIGAQHKKMFIHV